MRNCREADPGAPQKMRPGENSGEEHPGSSPTMPQKTHVGENNRDLTAQDERSSEYGFFREVRNKALTPEAQQGWHRVAAQGKTPMCRATQGASPLSMIALAMRVPELGTPSLRWERGVVSHE